jgi:circadian clock protein KaiB
VKTASKNGGARPSDYIFRLYVSGATALSARAVVNARKICDDHLKGRYQLEILDIADNVEMAMKDQIVAAPTLVKLAPAPLRRFIGDMSNAKSLLERLGVQPVG